MNESRQTSTHQQLSKPTPKRTTRQNQHQKQKKQPRETKNQQNKKTKRGNQPHQGNRKKHNEKNKENAKAHVEKPTNTQVAKSIPFTNMWQAKFMQPQHPFIIGGSSLLLKM